MAEHNETGRWGENIAEKYLISKGYAIARRNWRMDHLEIDIVAYKDGRIVFVEIKTRKNRDVDPLLSIDRRRILHLARAANVYVEAHDVPHEVQFDLIFIIGDPESGDNPEIEHIPDAFLPPLRTYR